MYKKGAWEILAEDAGRLVKRAQLYERSNDFQRGRILYVSAGQQFKQASFKVPFEDLRGKYKNLANLCYDHARILSSRQAPALPRGRFGVVLVEPDSPNPFRITPEMESIAKSCIAGKGDLESRANAIFNWMQQNIKYGGKRRGGVGYRRADEVMRSREGVCGEDTFAYVVMLRYAGLSARFAMVDVDCYGEPVEHACARVLSPRRFSSDVAYHLFDVRASAGVDHKKVRVATDEHATEMFKQWR